MTTKAQYAEQEEARAFLRERIQPGETLYTILSHVSRSGMRRHISVIQLTPDGPRDWSARVAQGAGMDMGFELVYSLSQALFDDDYALTHRWL